MKLQGRRRRERDRDIPAILTIESYLNPEDGRVEYKSIRG